MLHALQCRVMAKKWFEARIRIIPCTPTPTFANWVGTGGVSAFSRYSWAILRSFAPVPSCTYRFLLKRKSLIPSERFDNVPRCRVPDIFRLVAYHLRKTYCRDLQVQLSTRYICLTWGTVTWMNPASPCEYFIFLFFIYFHVAWLSPQRRKIQNNTILFYSRSPSPGSLYYLCKLTP